VIAWKDGESAPVCARPLIEVLRCPVCGQIDWTQTESALTCTVCQTSAVVRGGIIDIAPLLRGR
ncbi:MAG: hypothetical protein NZM00_12865, partial [Anaerolinea sp.]|nr:hypothetical protein [Anaerolinea sp.]